MCTSVENCCTICSLTIQSDAAKNARTRDIKNRSPALRTILHWTTSLDKSISSAVQKEASACLYKSHRLLKAMGNKIQRDILARRMGSATDSTESTLGSEHVRIRTLSDSLIDLASLPSSVESSVSIRSSSSKAESHSLSLMDRVGLKS